MTSSTAPHALVVERVIPTHARVIVVFGCTCAEGNPDGYTGDETTGRDEDEARANAAQHVANHAAIAGGNPLPALAFLTR